ncbi:ribonuclease R [Candidatus Contubernalis alkaliaceticus]|uniref:ribonuclease R n=1 Tax=Candidatus Contubernalis alkaliaceticus TaxID=338645 RepID=UPI001F4BE665|nr:ribonuclease R [Candidatus Contubernalis alkalaceticus]UNC90796.1 ribonuclease R [Candidatus Contubernalis alkalaceticus]
MSIKEKLLDYMREEAYKPLNLEELVTLMNTEKKDIKKFTRLLKDMEENGEIVKTRFNRYGVPERMNLVVGYLQAHPQGYGFILPEQKDQRDVFVSPNEINGAMHGDRVICRLLKKSDDKRPEGEIIRILDRANKTLVGTYESSQNYGFVVPDEHRIIQDIFIPKGCSRRAKNGDKVVVEITAWSEKRRNPQGNVIEVLGHKSMPGVDITSIIKKFNLPEEFPSEVLAEAQKYSDEIDDSEYEQRKDLRDMLIITIDDQEAKDLDDAVSLEKTGEGYRLGVHIADVGYYVREGSFLDREAFQRGTSVYLVDRVIPMLPPRLSNELCSLNPNIDRLTLSVLIDMSNDGKVINYEMYVSIININERMTYQNVNKIIEENDSALKEKYQEILPMLQNMQELAKTIKKNRQIRGSLGFDFPETYVKLDKEGHPIHVEERKRGVAESMIEEFMIACNEVVAEHFYHLKAPFLYRIHPDPDEEKIINFRDYITNFGYTLKGSLKNLHPSTLQNVLEQAQGKKEEKIIHTILLRSMKLARYYEVRERHFGLASEFYSHFTSPIRRYPDLVIHRITREIVKNGALSSKKIKKLKKDLPNIAEHCSTRERMAMEAERESQDLKKVEYMEKKVGQVFPAIISNIMNFGMFVMLENTIEGLVHISSMTDDYYHFIGKEFSLVGEKTKKTYCIGDPVKILVSKVNREERNIDFLLAD